MLTKEEQKQKEKEFYDNQEEYLSTGSKTAWDAMYMAVYNAIEFSIKKKLKGILRTDIEELAMDATVQVMARYKRPKGYKIEKLLTAAHWASVGVLYNKKQQFQDSQLSYDAWLEYQYNLEKK